MKAVSWSSCDSKVIIYLAFPDKFSWRPNALFRTHKIFVLMWIFNQYLNHILKNTMAPSGVMVRAVYFRSNGFRSESSPSLVLFFLLFYKTKIFVGTKKSIWPSRKFIGKSLFQCYFSLYVPVILLFLFF